MPVMKRYVRFPRVNLMANESAILGRPMYKPTDGSVDISTLIRSVVYRD